MRHIQELTRYLKPTDIAAVAMTRIGSPIETTLPLDKACLLAIEADQNGQYLSVNIHVEPFGFVTIPEAKILLENWKGTDNA